MSMQGARGLQHLLHQGLRAAIRELAPSEIASLAFAAGSREAAHLCASTSGSTRCIRTAAHDSQSGAFSLGFSLSDGMSTSSQSQWPSQQLRGLKVLKRKFKMPEEIAQIVQSKLEAASSAKSPLPTLPALEQRPMPKHSRRTGAIAIKAGMTQEWDQNGVRVPLTVLWIDDCQVVGLKWPEKHGYSALQLGAGWSRQTDLHPGVAGYFLSQGVPFKEKVVEFKVSRDALLPVGTQITAAHFVAGQHIDVTGWTKWKGFQGVMKRWNFKGLPASHGVSLSHRAPGSIGNRADPGKVWKGKKMPGNMGDERRTVHDCLVYKVDPARNLVYVRGQVPGPAGRMVLLRDAFNTQAAKRQAWQLPFPTYCGPGGALLSDTGKGASVPPLLEPLLKSQQEGGQLPALPDSIAGLLSASSVKVHQDTTKDPYLPYSKETDYFEVQWKKGE